MDFSGGGLDILLGLEADSGLRWSDIRAPSGHIDPEVFKHELIDCDGVSILSADPWNVLVPDVWEVRAALDALETGMDVLVCDCGHRFFAESDGLNTYELLKDSSHRVICLAELSVLGLARARVWLGEYFKASGEQEASRHPIVMGVSPLRVGGRGWSTKVSIPLEQASEYLDCEVIRGPVYDSELARSILEGLCVEKIPRRYQRVLDAVVKQMDAVN
jgi:hypothetical protein